jgi:hypothetical protein
VPRFSVSHHPGMLINDVLAIYYVDAVVYGLFFVALMYRFWQSRVRFYALYAIPVFLLFFADVLFIKHLFGDDTFTIILMIGQVASLLLAKTTVVMVRAWITSMRQKDERDDLQPSLDQQTVNTARWISLALWISFTVFSLVGVVLFILRITNGVDKRFTYISAGGFVLSAVGLMAVCVWLFVKTPAECADKKRQMARLMALTVLVSVPVVIYSATDHYFVGGVVYWLFVGIVLLPNALVGYNQPPERVEMITVV